MAEQVDLHALNALPQDQAEALLQSCCASSAFACHLCRLRPFHNIPDLLCKAAHVWQNEVAVSDWLEAFAAHPRIGSKKTAASGSASASASALASVKERQSQWSEGEQSAASLSSTEALSQELGEWNAKYEAKFGHVFLICAQGLPAAHILQQLKLRFGNAPLVELQNACQEQQKITELRILKLLRVDPTSASAAGSSSSSMSTSSPQPPTKGPLISTHVLDTVMGKPGAGIPVSLDQKLPPSPSGAPGWVQVGAGVTNADGRCGDLLQAGASRASLGQGDGTPLGFRLRFQTADYFARVHGGQAFFPSVAVEFELRPGPGSEKVHVPLLLAPFAYSTYRGS